MNFIEFISIINKYNLLTFIVISIALFALYEAIEMKWEGRNAKTNE